MWLISWLFALPGYINIASVTIINVNTSIFIITFIATYSKITYKLRKRSRQFSNQTNIPSNHHKRQFRKHYLVPFLVFMTFLLFGLIPYEVVRFVSPSLQRFFHTVQIITFIVDPSIYLFFHKDVQKVAVDSMKWFSKRTRKSVRDNVISRNVIHLNSDNIAMTPATTITSL